MNNKKTAVQQAYLERAQVLKETEGAPESTRVALSAISGRNILKTKKETAKIERDKQIAAMQQQALLQQGAANSALKMGQAKLSAAIQQDRNQRADAFRFMDAGVYDDTLAAALDAQRDQVMQYADVSRRNSALEQQRRSEAISILKMGVYDPSVAQALGFSEEVVKTFADRRTAEIADAIAKKKAAAQAQADYEAALENLQAENAKTQKKEKEIAAWYETEVDSAIDTFEKESASFDDANAAKKQILSSVNTEKAVIPWAEPAFKIDITPKLAGQLVLTPINAAKTYDEEETKKKNNVGFDYFKQKKANALPNDGVGDPRRAYQEKKENERISAALEKKEKRLQQAKEQREAELEQAKKNRQKAEQYYEQAMAKRVATKEAAEQALSALETAYKETALGKVYIAKEKINSALTLEEQASAYQEFANQITASYNEIGEKTSGILDNAFNRYNAGENLTEGERAAVQNALDEMRGIQYVLQDAVDSGLLTSESEQGYRDGISNIEKVISSLDAMELYADTYNEDDASYRVMYEQYGGKTIEELEAEAHQIEQDLLAEYGNAMRYQTAYRKAPAPGENPIQFENDPRYNQLQDLQWYIERRKGYEATEKENKNAIILSSVFDGATDVERISNAIDSVGADIDEYNQYNEFKYMNEALLYSLYETEKPEWLGAEVISETGGRYGYTGKQYRFYFNASNGEKWKHSLDYNQDGKFISVQDVEKRHKDNLEKQRILTNAYNRLSEDAAVGSLEGQDVGQLVAEFVSDYDADAFRNLGGKKDKYAHGDEYKSKGWLSSFYTDVDRFVEGEYGWFTEEDANTVLALLQNAGDDETKQDIAFSYYTKALERAKLNEAGELGGWKTVAGVTSGIGEFLTNGIFMLDNAMTGDYSRVQQTMFSAAHQLTMEEFSQKTGFANDTLEFLYQAGYTLVDMVPVVALSAIPYVGPVAGSGYLYAKSLATTYDDSIRNGKRADEAFTYATLTAVSEVALEKVFSGIANVGGSKSVGNLWKKAVEKLSTTSGVKTALKIAGNMGSEGFEEFLQEVLSPFLEKVAADVNGMTDAELGEIDWEEAGKSFLLGAVTGGFFGAFDLGGADQSAILSQRALQGDGADAISIIKMAADLGNQRAIRIKEAMQNKTPRYKDQAGVRQYASESDITNLRKSIRRKNKKVMLQNIRAELEADTTRDHSADDRIYGIFKELLLNHKIDVHQTADLINDPTALKILNRITGENVGAMMPTDAMYLARLASFTDQNGQVDQARIDALKDSFGELDYKAIEQILKYEDIVAEQRAEGNFSGILYDDPAVQEALSEDQKMITEEMKAVSDMTGFYFLVGNDLETGKYLGRNLLAVNSAELEKGAWYLICHNAYEMMQRFDQKKGNVFKDVLWDGITEMIGENGIETEKKKLRQQGVDEEYLEDELCARMMPSVLMRGSYEKVLELAKTDPATAESLCLILDSIRRYINTNFNTQNVDVLRDVKISPVDFKMKKNEKRYFDEIIKCNPRHRSACEKILKEAAENLSITGRKYFVHELGFEVGFSKGKNGLEESISKQLDYGGSYVDFLKVLVNLESVLQNSVLVEEHSDKYAGKRGEEFDLVRVYVLMGAIKEGDKITPVQFEIKRRKNKKGNIEASLYMVVAAKKIEIDVSGGKNSQINGDANSLVSISNYSISDFVKKINTKDKKMLRYIPDELLASVQIALKKEAIAADIKKVDGKTSKKHYEKQGINRDLIMLYDRLSEAVGDHYAVERAVSTERDPSAIFDGSEFTYADGERIAEENDGATWVKEFENMSPHEREVAIARQRADIDDLLALLTETERRIEAEDHTADEELVTTDTSETKKSIGESVSESWNFIRRRVTDVGATVYDIAKKTKDWKLYHYFNYARSSSNTAIKMVEDKQTDIAGNVVGKGLNEIFKPIMDRGAIFYRDFQLYLFHMHNVDRMSRESQQNIEAANDAFGFVVDMYPELRKYSEREILEISRDIDHPDNMGAVDYIAALRNKEYWSNLQNKPIFGYKVTAEISKGKAEDLLRRYPEFKELAKEVYQYSDNLMQYRVDSGLITKEFAAKLKEIYPHYVPTARVEGGSADAINAVSVGNKAIIGKTVGRAQGGDAMLIPLHKQFADQTMAVVREGSKNRFGSMLLDMAFDDAVPQVRKIEKTADRMSGIVSFDGQIDTVDPFKTEEFENIFVVYKDGEQYIMEVTPDLYEAAKSLSPNKEETNKVTSTARKANDLYKRLITGYNPAFAIRNFSRDIQDALLYTKDLKGFIQNYPLAWKEIVSNGEYWKKYQALGGTYSSVFDYKSGKVQKGKPIASQIEAVNMAIEQVARLAEFMSTVKKGDGGMDNLMEAMYNAAEITTNFGRSGTVGGFLNKNFVPFLNPSIQGFSKICRTLTETKGFRPWFFLVTKAAFLGWAIPSVLNGLLWGDDDEWDLIKQRDKDLNYLFKVKDGVWLKVPKGRVLSVLGMAGHRIQQEIQGEDADWGEFVATASSQVSPTNPLTNNIVTPFVGVVSNRNWYGGEIVGQSLQNLPKAEQYDAKTDVISIWLGEVLNVSPKKINYLFDQYTGVIGDIVLPALSVASERGFWENAFTIDSDFSNRLSGDFYDQLQELTEKKSSVSGTAEDVARYRWWNRKAGELSEVNKKINEVQEDSSLTKKEKEDELKLLYASRNAVILKAEEEAETYFGAVEDIADGLDLSSDDAADVLYREANRKAFGAEEALKMYNKDTYERAVKVRDEMGIDFETFYNVYFDDTVGNDQMFKMLQSGMDYDGAAEISQKLNVLEPEDGAQSVSYMQKYEAIAETDVTDETKLAAMKLFATDADRRRVTIGNEYGITLDQFINVKSNIEALNEMEGKTTASNARIEAAVRHQRGLTDKQRAVLWQVFTSSDSAKKNPFSIAVGAETLKKIEEAKVKEE